MLQHVSVYINHHQGALSLCFAKVTVLISFTYIVIWSYRYCGLLCVWIVHSAGQSMQPQLAMLASCQQTCMTYTIAVCTVKKSWWWTEDCPKRIEFYSKNKSEKLVHLVGFIIRMYHDARCPERQKTYSLLWFIYCDSPFFLW